MCAVRSRSAEDVDMARQIHQTHVAETGVLVESVPRARISVVDENRHIVQQTDGSEITVFAPAIFIHYCRQTATLVY
jgi:hypothetical protein